ncbi:stage II sporulation protein D [Paenibacillus sp. J31TS4]|uniref:stage II sporulation protein D n=1 Tax=Paenibacillus sp. J31TS4 TaxID=2807195 RepID=UPI001AFF7619|nr:stage II sporulation protein D [Paenibacillus sp. J31TS4]GIP40958.1 stage II sporulation protein D [Paenibacillus sp. J31TS4]
MNKRTVQLLYKRLARAMRSRRGRWWTWLGLWVAGSMAVTILLPGFLAVSPAGGAAGPGARSAEQGAAPSGGGPGTQPGESAAAPPVIPVYLTKEARIDQVELETYVRGVVAAEMPIEFELEALKAQAMAARTYIVRRWLAGDHSNVPAPEALVTDTVAHQVYLTDEQLRQQWGANADRYFDKLQKAVQATKGWILTYEDQPIEAFFFSTSNGYTENSEDYWGKAIPYLRAVESPWDKNSAPKFRETVTMPYQEFAAKLGIPSTYSASATITGSRILKLTDGHRVASVRIGGKTLTGREVREKLKLNSTQFQWSLKGSTVEIATTGYGHGVGMSQWGANGMAKEGSSAEQIVGHYYTGVTVWKNGDYSKLKE